MEHLQLQQPWEDFKSPSSFKKIFLKTWWISLVCKETKHSSLYMALLYRFFDVHSEVMFRIRNIGKAVSKQYIVLYNIKSP